MAKLKVGIIGCGAIGSSLIREITKSFSSGIKIVGLYDLDKEKVLKLLNEFSLDNSLCADNLEDLIHRAEFIIEATSKDAVWEVVQKTIRKKKDILILSIGGIITHFKELLHLTEKYKTKIYLPSGAIVGLDAFKALSLGKIRKLILITRKPPHAFLKVKYVDERKINLVNLKKEKVIFSGPAHKAIEFFPQNINVAAIIKIAINFSFEPYVKIIASPFVKKNIHEIVVKSSYADILIKTENSIHPQNPKTSYLTVLSVLATLKEILSPIKIGT